MLTNGEEIIMLDHEIAFSFVFNLFDFSPVNIWEMNDEQKGWLNHHVLIPFIKGKVFDYDLFAAKLEVLNADFWNRVGELMPNEWKTDQLGKIKDRLDKFILDRDKLFQEIKLLTA